MAAKRVTYNDLRRLLEVEGFQATAVKDGHVRFDNPGKQAALVLPKEKHTQPASLLDIELVRRTVVDFGVMVEAEFDRWITDPKHFQAA